MVAQWRNHATFFTCFFAPPLPSRKKTGNTMGEPIREEGKKRKQSYSPGHPLVTTKSGVHNMFYKTCVDDLASFNFSLEFSTKSFFLLFLRSSPWAKNVFCRGVRSWSFVETLGCESKVL